MSKFQVGDRVDCRGTEGTVVVAQPDATGRIVVCMDDTGMYDTFFESVPSRVSPTKTWTFKTERRTPEELDVYLDDRGWIRWREVGDDDYPDVADVLINDPCIEVRS